MRELIHAWVDDAGHGLPGFGIAHVAPDLDDRVIRMLCDRSGLQMTSPHAPTSHIAHRILQVQSEWCSVLTRIDPMPPEKGLPRRLARHLVIRPDERPDVGPVAMLGSSWFCDNQIRPIPTEFHPSPSHPIFELDQDWHHLLQRRIESGAAATLLVGSSNDMEPALRAIEECTHAESSWAMTFVTGDSPHRDGAIFHITHEKESTEGAGVLLDLRTSPSSDDADPKHDEQFAGHDAPPQIYMDGSDASTKIWILWAIGIAAAIILLFWSLRSAS